MSELKAPTHKTEFFSASREGGPYRGRETKSCGSKDPRYLRLLSTKYERRVGPFVWDLRQRRGREKRQKQELGL